MKVIKLPEFCDPNNAILRKVIDENRRCPFCGYECDDDEHIDLGGIDEAIKKMSMHGWRRTGIGKPWYKHIFDKPCYWCVADFECSKCGGVWETDEYPVFKNGDDEMYSSKCGIII